MKTFIADIIPKIQRFSQKLDNLTLLTNQHWVVVDEIANSKNVYIFRSNNELLISQNGKVEKARWEYLGNNALLIDRKDESYLFKHGFFDENVLALKVDGKEEYAILVNESKYNKELNSLKSVVEFLNIHYVTHNTILDALESKVDESPSSQILYSCPKYEITSKIKSSSYSKGIMEKYAIQFADGTNGEVYFIIRNESAYFIAKPPDYWLPLKFFYDNLEYCINALHYFLTTKKILHDGFSYSV